MSDTYEGWANRETWALMLHINNDQGLYEEFRNAVRYVPRDHFAADIVRERVTELFQPDYWADTFDSAMPREVEMMRTEVGSLWRVDWSEVVAALLEE